MSIATTVTRQDIVVGLRELGVEAGDSIMVHSSLKSFGLVDGGPDAVVDALLDAVGPGGLAIAPALTATFVDSRDTGGLVFDPATTPSRVGIVTETFRRRPEARRSTHPTHSIAAIGPRAEELVATREEGSTFDIEGPYRRLIDWGAKIVFLGVYPVCNTTLHVIEDWLDMPYMTTESVHVMMNGEPAVRTVTRSPWGCRGFYRRSGLIHGIFEQKGLYRRAQVGPAELIGLTARETIDVTAQAEIDHPGVLLLYQDGSPCSEAELAKVKAVRERILADLADLKKRGIVLDIE